MTSLVKKIDAEKSIKSFVVFLTDEENLEAKLKEYAEKNNISHTVLAIDNVAGPKGYNIAKEADVTVLLYNKRKVEANHAFRKGELNAQGVEKVVSDLSKIKK